MIADNTAKTPQTLAEFCGLDDAVFEQYLEQKDNFLKVLDEKADARIAAGLEKRLSWVA